MFDKINSDIINAMKEKKSETLNTLRLLKGAIQLEEINKKTKLSDEDIVGIVSKQIKSRKDSIEEFKKGNRTDLIEKAEKEIELLKQYLPEQLSDEEVEKIIDEAIFSVNAKSPSDIGKVMGALMPKIKGKTDVSKTSIIVKSKLN